MSDSSPVRKLKVAVLYFPGTNCDRDIVEVFSQNISEVSVEILNHRQVSASSLGEFGAVILPGGFSYGDILRPGALASHSPAMEAIKEYARRELGLILGICNGFQILCEAGLLPGALWLNREPRFLCRRQQLEVVNSETPFTSLFQERETVQFPIAHIWGNYRLTEAELNQLERRGQIVFTYRGSNPNGSAGDIAGVVSENRMILGLMPHPERNALEWQGDGSGLRLFLSMVRYIREHRRC